MTIDTQEALRLLDELFACIERKDLCGCVGYGDQLRALLSAKEGEPRISRGLFVVFGSDPKYGNVCIDTYCGTVADIRRRIMEGARREGFTGDFVERMAELGWWLEPLYTNDALRDAEKEKGNG